MDGFLSFLLMALESSIVMWFALELTASHEVNFLHFGTLGWSGIIMLDKVERIWSIQESRPLSRLVAGFFLGFQRAIIILDGCRSQTLRPLIQMAKVLPIKRFIVGNGMFLVGNVVLPFKFELIHAISAAFVELIVVGRIGSLEWDFMIIFWRARDFRYCDYSFNAKVLFSIR